MSPIKDERSIVRLPRIGKIHLGVKEISPKSKKEYPKQVDYFVFPEEWLQVVKEVYGSERPDRLPILIPVDDEEIWIPRYYKRYNASGDLLCRGDGEVATCMVDVSTGEIPEGGTEEKNIQFIDRECQGMDCPSYTSEKCVKMMCMQFILPDLPGGFGVWQLDSRSINGWRNIQSMTNMIRMAYGSIAMVPGIFLTLEPQAVRDPKRKKRTMPILNLRIERTFKEMLLDAQERKQLGAGQAYSLPQPDEANPDLLIPDNQMPQEERDELEQQAAAAAQDQGETDPEWEALAKAEGVQTDETPFTIEEPPEPKPLDREEFIRIASVMIGTAIPIEIAKVLGWKMADLSGLEKSYGRALSHIANKPRFHCNWHSKYGGDWENIWKGTPVS